MPTWFLVPKAGLKLPTQYGTTTYALDIHESIGSALSMPIFHYYLQLNVLIVCYFKGSLTRDFRLQVFFINQCPPGL
jgi:hypothetical protein